jgi:hypothetical protein
MVPGEEDSWTDLVMVERTMNGDTVKLGTMQTAGPNPDPIISIKGSRDSPDKADVDNSISHGSNVAMLIVEPPPDGGRKAWLVVLGGFLLMFTSFGFSEFS